jgi:hypothetical protein
MMIMNNNTPSITMTIYSLASFPFSILESVLPQCPQEVANRNIFKFMDHRETATAGSSMISNVSDEDGIPSPASTISSI